MWVRFPSSAPERKEKLEFYITLIFFIGNRKGGSGNSPVDYFPDAARRFPSSAPENTTTCELIKFRKLFFIL